MNRMDLMPHQHREAKLRYLDHEFEVLTPGQFVRCAVTGSPIQLDDLRYWSVDQQVAYKSAQESFAEYCKRKSG